ncbi:MerR family transcriptional regulator [Marinisporobacter balticus]|uniref:DNA-binding transcriptional MerR regulator n=1 Tax=Marinisporobacter balticus TaxID=2018667 RepID=A0A4R2K8H2_9FIRM|nr:MerR family transcriptional regulator [Marinisporobacter balticus]TCO68914.1 DNA-binding transcriptional MerR regulator [Marinisporobacter balticus]
MLNIGNFSKLTHVSVRMLRYYDEHGLLKPNHIDKHSGYRMYSVKQVPDLQKIVLLRDLNFSVANISELLKNWNDRFLIEQLNNKIHETEQNIHLENERINRIRAAISDIHKDQIDIHYNVTIKSIPSYNIVSFRKKIPEYSYEGNLWYELIDFINREHLDIERHSYNNITIYHDEGHVDTDVDVEVAFVVKKLSNNIDHFIFRELESVNKMACMMVYGSYEKLTAAYQSFIYWLDAHSQYEMNGLSRQVTIIGKTDTSDPNDYLTEIQIPVQIAQKKTVPYSKDVL